MTIEITEGSDGDRFWRADAVAVSQTSPDRVTPPCPYAGPDRCGGCDFQHVSLDRQRRLKADVVREQLARLAGVEVDVTVEPVPGDDDGLRWRTRQRYVELPGGRLGMRKHRSHDVVEVDDCLIAGAVPSYVVRGPGGERRFEVPDGGFWQVHPGAPEALVGTVLSWLDPQPGERVLDLYAGVGLFARFLADAVGPDGAVTLVEGDRAACAAAVANVPEATVVVGDVRASLEELDEPSVDLVVLDPPREGAKRRVVEQVVGRHPRAVAYVACDPAALARDMAIFDEHGYRLDRLRALDLFPMTSHVECVAHLIRSDSDLRRSPEARHVAGSDSEELRGEGAKRLVELEDATVAGVGTVDKLATSDTSMQVLGSAEGMPKRPKGQSGRTSRWPSAES